MRPRYASICKYSNISNIFLIFEHAYVRSLVVGRKNPIQYLTVHDELDLVVLKVADLDPLVLTRADLKPIIWQNFEITCYGFLTHFTDILSF